MEATTKDCSTASQTPQARTHGQNQ